MASSALTAETDTVSVIASASATEAVSTGSMDTATVDDEATTKQALIGEQEKKEMPSSEASPTLMTAEHFPPTAVTDRQPAAPLRARSARRVRFREPGMSDSIFFQSFVFLSVRLFFIVFHAKTGTLVTMLYL
jgi:hypothetical protein